MRRVFFLLTELITSASLCAQDLKLNDLEYFERQGVNVLVFSNSFNGGFNDEKNSGIEIIHHGVRTVQGGAGVPIGLGNWAGVNAVLNFGVTVNYAHIYFPDIISKDEVYRVANWLYGCHPYHNYSFVAVVGATRPKQVFYGNNRADFSAIPGNVAPGLLFRKPDHFENYDDWPFLWGQNEGTIAGNTQYIIFGSALKNIVGTK